MKIDSKYNKGDELWAIHYNKRNNKKHYPDCVYVKSVCGYIENGIITMIYYECYNSHSDYEDHYSDNELFKTEEECQAKCNELNMEG